MGKFLISYDNQSEQAILSGGSWISGLPLNNLRTDDLAEVARSTNDDPSSTKFDITLPSLVGLQCIVLGPTNLTTAYKIRYRAWAEIEREDGEEIYDSGVIEGSARAEWNSLTWEDPDFWLGYQPPDDIDRGITEFHILPTSVAQLYWRIEIEDPGNPDGYIEIGHLLMGRTLSPSVSYGYGKNGLSFKDITLKRETLSGGKKFRRRPSLRVLQVGFDALTDAEAFSDFYNFTRVSGFDRIVAVVPDTDDTGLRLQRRAFFASVSQADPIVQSFYGHASAGYTFEERLT